MTLRTSPLPLLAATLAATLAAASCSYEGTFEARIYGEEFIEEGIPADAFVDGWTVTFDKFLVVVGDLEVDGGAATIPGWHVVDLTTATMGAGQALGRVDTASGTITRFGYRIAPSADAEPTLATAADLELIAGHSIYVAGAASRGAETFTFAWAFATDTRYSPCAIAAELEPGGEASAQITVHADHLFYDDLDSAAPNVAFDLIAGADADADGAITEAELAAVDITGEARYQVGSRDVTDLWGFIAAQTATLGHIDGEGHCDTAP